jgi:hypothetical protein
MQAEYNSMIKLRDHENVIKLYTGFERKPFVFVIMEVSCDKYP